MTLDLPPAEHAALRHLCMGLADDLGVVEVTARDVLRALLRRAVDDEAARAQLRVDLGAVRQ